MAVEAYSIGGRVPLKFFLFDFVGIGSGLVNRKQKPSGVRCELTADPVKRAAADKLAATVKTSLPAGLSQPALRAFAAAGLRTIDDFAHWSEVEVLALHGVGPTAIAVLKAELKLRKLRFRE